MFVYFSVSEYSHNNMCMSFASLFKAQYLAPSIHLDIADVQVNLMQLSYLGHDK